MSRSYRPRSCEACGRQRTCCARLAMPSDFCERWHGPEPARSDRRRSLPYGGMSALTGKATERAAVFQPEFREDLCYWVENDWRVALRVIDLVEAGLRDPFLDIGETRAAAPPCTEYVVAACHPGTPPRLSRPSRSDRSSPNSLPRLSTGRTRCSSSERTLGPGVRGSTGGPWGPSNRPHVAPMACRRRPHWTSTAAEVAAMQAGR